MDTKLITPGDLAPDFELKDINGNSIRLSSFRGRKPVVLAFLRGFL
jgi:peroxiredoxin